MPKYQFVCEAGHAFRHYRPFEVISASPAVACVSEGCPHEARRVFSTAIQLNTRPQYLEDGNKFFLGTTSQKEMNAIMRRDEKAYENRKPVGEGPTKAHLL